MLFVGDAGVHGARAWARRQAKRGAQWLRAARGTGAPTASAQLPPPTPRVPSRHPPPRRSKGPQRSKQGRVRGAKRSAPTPRPSRGHRAGAPHIATPNNGHMAPSHAESSEVQPRQRTSRLRGRVLPGKWRGAELQRAPRAKPRATGTSPARGWRSMPKTWRGQGGTAELWACARPESQT